MGDVIHHNFSSRAFDDREARVTSASKPNFVKQQKPAEVVLMMTPDEPFYTETKLQILAARYWGKS